GGRMARPILRLATRITRRTRATAVAIAFACMVLVGALSLADGLANGIASVADRIGAGPAVYIRGDELLSSDIDPVALGNLTGDFVAMRVHPAALEINGIAIAVIAVALEAYHGGIGTTSFPVGANDVSLDVGLRSRIVAASGIPGGTSGNLSGFGRRLTDLPIVAPPTHRQDTCTVAWACDPGKCARDRGGPCRRLRRTAPRPAEPDPPLAARRPRGSRVRGRPPRGRGRRNRAIAARRGPRQHEGGSPILVRPRTFGGVLLCAVLLGATWPILAALPGVPSQILAGDAYVITQGSGALSINASLAENLTA